MNSRQLWTFALCLSLSLTLCLSAPAAGHEISGELVILKTGNRQFRIVDQPGSFTAPSGVSLEEFDGKPVRVELGSNRQVLSITEKSIETDPMMRHYQIITGQLVVNNAASGAFTITGDGRPFLAPLGVDIRPYANQMVDVFLDEQGKVKSIDRAKSSMGPSDYPPAVLPSTGCAYNGRSYGDGMMVCQVGARYRCDGGMWRSLAGPCAASSEQPCLQDGVMHTPGSTRCYAGSQLVCDNGIWRDVGTACVSDVTTAQARARSCLVGDATVASGSTICRSGVTFRCADGNWNSIGTPCR